MDTVVVVPLFVAAIGLIGAALAALVSRRHDRDQQARQMMFEPADAFARTVLVALAQLRYVTPPDELDSRLHRNVGLLGSPRLREDRLTACEVAIDGVREARAGVTLVFHPKSWPAEQAKMIGAVLRECLELVESFYARADAAAEQGLPDLWREAELQDVRLTYISKRRDVRKLLNSFYDSVAHRMVRPTWDPQKIEEASWDRVFGSDAT